MAGGCHGNHLATTLASGSLGHKYFIGGDVHVRFVRTSTYSARGGMQLVLLIDVTEQAHKTPILDAWIGRANIGRVDMAR